MEVFGLKEKDINAINDVFNQYPEIIQVIIYGSRAKGNYKPGSDIDLSIEDTTMYLLLVTKLIWEYIHNCIKKLIGI